MIYGRGNFGGREMKTQKCHFGTRPRAIKYLSEEGYTMTGVTRGSKEVWIKRDESTSHSYASLDHVTKTDAKGDFKVWQATFYDR